MAVAMQNAIKASPPPKGIYVPAPTFFKLDDVENSIDPCQLDLETQSRHTLFLVKNGVQGVVLLGSTGEAIVVSSTERAELIRSQRLALDAAGFQDRPIIAGTTSQSIPDVLDSIKISRDAGASYAMVLAPGFFSSVASQAGITEWFKKVGDHAVLPILVYHYPGVSNGLQIAPSTFEALAEHPNVVGTKLSHAIIDDQTLIASSPRVDHASFHTFTGLGQILLPFTSIGGAGAIDGLAGCFPRLVVRLYHLCTSSSTEASKPHAGSIGEVRKLQHSVCEGEKLIARWGVVGMKEALSRVWQISDPRAARLPLTGGFPGGENEWAQWKEIFEHLKQLEQSLA